MAINNYSFTPSLRWSSADQVFSGGGGGSGSEPILLSRLNLSGGIPTGSGAGNWGFGAQSGATIVKENDGTHDYIKATYPIDTTEGTAGDNYVYGGYSPETLQQELFITIYARMPGTYRNGMKFCKLFGGLTNSGNDYANATFTLETYGDQGSMYYAAYGDGATAQNDSQNGIAFYEPNYIDTGRTGTLTQTFERGGVFNSSDWGTGWNKFQLRLKQNSGTSAENEVNDGAIEVYINGIMHGRAINIFNRHWSNAFIETINFFGYSRGATEAFEIHMRDITVSTGDWVD